MASSLLSLPYDLFQVAKGTNFTFLTIQHSRGVDLKDKWIVISGSNNGVGFEAARSFAAWGANLILACRQPPAWERHPEAAVKECRAVADMQGHRSSTIEWWELDMADLDSVEAFARRWLDSGRVLDVLCNNAGAPTTSNTNMTKNGFQLVHQVNLLSHVLLTLRLLPSLARSADPRIVCTTSNLHHVGILDFDHFNCGRDMKGSDYPNNKLYFQMWVAELQARLLKHPAYSHITIMGVHPGFVASGIWSGIDENDLSARVMRFLMPYLAITPQQGSLAITYAVTSPQGDGRGKYFNRIWEAPSKSYCHDRDARAKLWIKLDEALGLQEKGLLTILGR